MATVLLLLLWIVGSLASGPLRDGVVVVAEAFEVGLGLDVLPGRPDNDGEGG